MAPLLPKLRGHFAEFLNHDSLARLSILYLTTCVGLGYGRLEPHVEAFLGSTGSLCFPTSVGHHPASPLMFPGFAWGTGCAVKRGKPLATRSYHSASPLLTRLSTTRSGPTLPDTITPEGVDGWFGWLVSLGSTGTVLRRYQNINWLTIDYACRPRLRTRLTQGGRTWPWNP